MNAAKSDHSLVSNDNDNDNDNDNSVYLAITSIYNQEHKNIISLRMTHDGS